MLSGSSRRPPAGFEVGEEDFVLDQIQPIRLPEAELVEEYHRCFGHSDSRPSKGEIETAYELLAKYGKEQLRELIPLTVKQMKAKWPGAKTFSAIRRYMDETNTPVASTHAWASLPKVPFQCGVNTPIVCLIAFRSRRLRQHRERDRPE